MSKLAKNALSFSAFVAAFFAAKYAVQEFREQRSVAKVDQEIRQLQETAKKKHPDELASIAFRKEAQERTAESLASSDSEWKKLNTAADSFYGFYFLNTRSRNEFCKQRGVDLTPFVKEFSDIHVREYAKAKSIYKQAGADEEKVWSQMRSIAADTLAQDMQDMASTYQISLEEVCHLLAENAAQVVPEMHLSKASPAVYHVLSSGL